MTSDAVKWPLKLRAAFIAASIAATGALAIVGATPAHATNAGLAIPRSSPLAVGGSHVLALDHAGHVRAWGANGFGQLGIGTWGDSGGPAFVKSPSGTGELSNVSAVAAGDSFSLALRSNGTVDAWGENLWGEVGDGTKGTLRTLPVPVKGAGGAGALTNVVAIAAGTQHALALKSDGTVWAWGNDSAGQLGVGGTAAGYRAVPVEVKGPGGSGALSKVVAIGAGENTSMAVRSDGTVWTWGVDGHHELGDGDATGTIKKTPVQVRALEGHSGYLNHVVAASMGADATIAELADGTVVSWGDNVVGELGVGDQSPHAAPVPVTAARGAAAVGGGYEFNFLVYPTGATYAWGGTNFGSLGDGFLTRSDHPVAVFGFGPGSKVAGAASGGSFAAAVKTDGSVWTWGRDDHNQLGDGKHTTTTTPHQVPGVIDVGNPALFLLTTPKITGTAKVGHVLTSSPGAWGLPATSVTYQWLRNGHPISGATHHTYTLTTADTGQKISARVEGHRAGFPHGTTTTTAVTVS